MNSHAVGENLDLSLVARAIFADALKAVDAGRSLKNAVVREADRLRVFEKEYDLRKFSEIYSVALGKAAAQLAAAFGETLGARLTAGVVSAPQTFRRIVEPPWQFFAGGHPSPNELSLEAARAAADMLAKANKESALVIFLVSGGGSSMMELPRDPRLTLADLRAANEVLIGCGATIAEINAIRRRLSAVKGGGLSLMANRAAKFSLVVSDTNSGEIYNVASGPTVSAAEKDLSSREVRQIANGYGVFEKLPPMVADVLKTALSEDGAGCEERIENHEWAVLLSNKDAVRAAERSAALGGFLVETVENLVEAPVGEGCRELARRLIELRRKTPAGQKAALVSGGEFVCPVRGRGIGGRNSEAALRTALEIKKQAPRNFRFAALFAGTDGIDGNSPAAGAVADHGTLEKAAALGLDAREFLAHSDSYGFFAPLGDAILTGPTGTNVRDVRILLAD
jgi:glycerate 2-kinase